MTHLTMGLFHAPTTSLESAAQDLTLPLRKRFYLDPAVAAPQV